MELNNYLLQALLIAACIPVLDVIATWYYARGVRQRDGQVLDGQGFDAQAQDRGPQPAATSPAAGPQPLFAAFPAQLSEQAQRLGVGFNGRQFTYAGYTYDRATDAVAYAELVRKNSSAGAAGPGDHAVTTH
jgi:hypothetical protein